MSPVVSDGITVVNFTDAAKRPQGRWGDCMENVPAFVYTSRCRLVSESWPSGS
jgi:hypothetical protein